MKLSEIININSIKAGLKVDSKEQLLDEMLNLAANTGKIFNKEKAMQDILTREKVVSTGVGKGIALPHAKTAWSKETVVSFATLANPVDFNSVDGEPVRIVFMVICNEGDVANHLRLLLQISKLTNIDDFREKVVCCVLEKEIIKLISEFEDGE
ncbi:MAG: system component, Fru family [Ignavibacteria bacterium]|nr:system component, Fru family [Ignavibacteria bacterium]